MIYYGPREWLKERCKAKKLTQLEAAIAVGVTPEYFQKIIYGTKNPSLDLAVKIAKLLNFPVEWFVQSNVQSHVSVAAKK